MVRSVSSQTCSACQEKLCLTGSVKGWGCPYGLCVGEIDRNNDCGACMECVKTCAYDNVAVFWRSEGWDKDIASYGEAWQAMVMFPLACLYSIMNLGAWDKIRDWTDLIDKKNWGSFSIYALVVWVVCLGVLPAFVVSADPGWDRNEPIHYGCEFSVSGNQRSAQYPSVWPAGSPLRWRPCFR